MLGTVISTLAPVNVPSKIQVKQHLSRPAYAMVALGMINYTYVIAEISALGLKTTTVND